MKSTYSLDPETVKALEALAKRWGVPKSEALRRVIRKEFQRSASQEPDAIRALNELQASLDLSSKDVREWVNRAREERRAYSRRLEGVKPR